MSLLEALAGIRTDFLDAVFLVVTQFGGEIVFSVTVMIFLWCADKRVGFDMIFAWSAGSAVCQLMKVSFLVPRPWVRDPGFRPVEAALADAGGYSFPSGHSQTAAAVFGFSAASVRRGWLRAVFIIIIPLVMFSRMYLGVHTPSDVLVGMLVGIVPAAAVLLLSKKEKLRLAVYAFPLLPAAALLIFTACSGRAAGDATFAEGLFNSGKLLGSALALIISAEYDRRGRGFEVRAVWWAQICKCLVGLAGLLAVRSGLKALFALFTAGLDGGALLAAETALGGLRYFAVMLFAGMLYPMTFRFWSKLR